jgi:PE family
MSFIITQPETLAAAARTLEAIRSAIAANDSAAAGPTTGVTPAAADEVSALTATQFAMHAAMYQTISAEAATIHQQLVATLSASAASYASTEAANAMAAL